MVFLRFLVSFIIILYYCTYLINLVCGTQIKKKRRKYQPDEARDTGDVGGPGGEGRGYRGLKL